MEGLTKLLLISIFDALLARAQSGRFSGSWDYTPEGGFHLSVHGEDGTSLFAWHLSSHLLKELRSKLNVEATGGERL